MLLSKQENTVSSVIPLCPMTDANKQGHAEVTFFHFCCVRVIERAM